MIGKMFCNASFDEFPDELVAERLASCASAPDGLILKEVIDDEVYVAASGIVDKPASVIPLGIVGGPDVDGDSSGP